MARLINQPSSQTFAQIPFVTIFVILQNWGDYDKQKSGLGEDARLFRPTEEWEVEFLTSKIRRVYPFISAPVIFKAITSVNHLQGGPASREEFVRDVLCELGIPED
jgi:hypothetical protein